MTDNNMILEFRVPGIPVSQPRQRHRICTSGGKTIACNYTPAKHPVNDFKAAIRLFALSEFKSAPLTGAVRVWVTTVFPRPKSLCKKKSRNERIPKTSKPDIDNLCKSVFDALNGVVWKDDSQVASLIAAKELCGDDEQPHTLIAIAAM